MLNIMTAPKPQGFAQELAQYIAHPPASSIKMLITPEMALEMLTFNNRNRPVSDGVVRRYASQMLEGKWRYTRVPLIFSDGGRLIDGQHRLCACVDAEVAFEADVVFGAPDDAFDVIDVGKSRGAADIFAINGVNYAKDMAAIARIVWKYDNGRQTLSGGLTAASTSTITHGDLYVFFTKLEDPERCIPVLNHFKSSRLASPSLMASLHFICARKHRAQADAFFQIISEGGGSPQDPAQDVHRRLIRNATAQDKMSVDYIAKLVLHAWNRSRAGLTARGIRVTDGKLPAVR